MGNLGKAVLLINWLRYFKIKLITTLRIFHIFLPIFFPIFQKIYHIQMSQPSNLDPRSRWKLVLYSALSSKLPKISTPRRSFQKRKRLKPRSESGRGVHGTRDAESWERTTLARLGSPWFHWESPFPRTRCNETGHETRVQCTFSPSTIGETLRNNDFRRPFRRTRCWNCRKPRENHSFPIVWK